jgi:polysaccharide biosynthesis transport protein
MLEEQFPEPLGQGMGDPDPSGSSFRPGNPIAEPSRRMPGPGKGFEPGHSGNSEREFLKPSAAAAFPGAKTPGKRGGSENGSYGGYGGYGSGYGAETETGRVTPSFQDYFNLLKRHLWVVILPTVLGALAGVYLFQVSPSQYRSWTSIEVERVKQEAAGLKSEDQEKIRLTGFAVLQATVEKLRMPRIYQGVASNSLFFNRKNVLPKTPVFRMPWSGGTEGKPEQSQGEVSTQALAVMMPTWIQVNWRENTNLIDIFCTHTDPEVARDVLQALLVEYEKLTEAKAASNTSYTMEYILAKSKELKEGMVKAQGSLSRYNRCMDLNTQVRTAENTVIQMERRYLDKWPQLIEARQLVTNLKEKFVHELEQVLASTPEESEFWKQQSGGFASLKGDDLIEAHLKAVEARASILRKDLESNQAILDTLLKEYGQGEVAKDYNVKQFEIVQPPTISYQPVAPVLMSIMRTTVGVGIFSGLVIIFLIGLFDRTLRTVSDLEQNAEIPVVGAIPDCKSTSRKHQLVMLEEREPSVVESVRTVRAGLVYLGDQDERKSFVVTSSVPGEGKSWLAANLAVAFAQQGDRTVLIDGDLRRGTQWLPFDLERDLPGLTDILAKRIPLDQACHPTGVDNLSIIPGGSRSPNPAELLGSKNLAPLMVDLHRQFDRIIIDTAPIVPVSDTLPLAKLCQTVLMVFRIGKTPRAALRRSLKVLRANRTEPVGIIANRLPRTKGARSQAYYYSYYGGDHYSGYYGTARGKMPSSD